MSVSGVMWEKGVSVESPTFSIILEGRWISECPWQKPGEGLLMTFADTQK